MSGQLYSAPFDFRIPAAAPSNLDSPVRIALEEVYTSLNIVARALVNGAGIGPQVSSLWPHINGSTNFLLSGNLRRFYARAWEDMDRYNLISVYDAGGPVVEMRLADATNNTKAAVGYCNTPGGLIVGQVGEFILNSGVPLFAGLTPGAHYWLATTPGTITTVRPVAVGNIEQYVGVALSATELNFNCSGFIQH